MEYVYKVFADRAYQKDGGASCFSGEPFRDRFSHSPGQDF